MMSERTKKSYKNIKIVFLYYFLFLFLSFFSRKIFLNSLGAEFIGLTGTLSNILGLLSLAELGIGTAIMFHLYDPLNKNDHDKISELVSLIGWLYRYIGLFILTAGIIVSCFFPLIFKDRSIGLPIVYFSFFCLLTSSLVGYFINYRQILLNADQKGYVVSAYIQTGLIIKILIQMLICYLYRNLYLWISIEFIFSIISALILNYKINKEYPWLKLSIKNGKIFNKKYPSVLVNTRRIFFHKMKDFLLGQSDSIFVFAFVSLSMVAYYGNYTLLVSKLNALFTSVFNSICSSIGDLVAEGDKNKIKSLFWELNASRFLGAGIITLNIYFLSSPFICLWLGRQYELSNIIVLLLSIYTFISLTRGTVDNFNHAYGNYDDVWSAWVEAIINISITIIFAIHHGIAGILMGKIASLLFIVIWWKPYYLFRKGFKIRPSEYFKGIYPYYLNFIFVASCVYCIQTIINLDPRGSWGEFAIYAIIIFIISSILYTTSMMILFSPIRDFMQRLLKSRKFF